MVLFSILLKKPPVVVRLRCSRGYTSLMIFYKHLMPLASFSNLLLIGIISICIFIWNLIPAGGNTSLMIFYKHLMPLASFSNLLLIGMISNCIFIWNLIPAGGNTSLMISYKRLMPPTSFSSPSIDRNNFKLQSNTLEPYPSGIKRL